MLPAGCPGWTSWSVYTLVRFPIDLLSLLFEDLGFDQVVSSSMVKQILEGQVTLTKLQEIILQTLLTI